MKPYKKLSIQEQRYFDILVHDLEYCGLLSEADSVLVTRTAKSLSLLDQADNDLKNNQIQEYANGTRQVSPELTVYKTHLSHVEGFLKQLGLTPAVRDKMRMEKNEEVSEPFDIILNQSHTG